MYQGHAQQESRYELKEVRIIQARYHAFADFRDINFAGNRQVVVIKANQG